MERLLTPEEVCQRYSIKKNTLYQWTSKNLIPYLKRGGLRFKENELEKWENRETSNIRLI
jgi:excisionase family DNA binding protein